MNNKKKNIFITVITLLFLISSILIIADYVSYKFYKMKNKNYFDEYHKYKKKTEEEIAKKYIFDTSASKPFRTIENKKSNSRSILLFGISDVYGTKFKREETISYRLSKLTPRTIYNRVKMESCPNHMYYQLSCEEFYKIVKKPKYIFYFYTPKQIILTNHKYDFGPHDIYYELKDNKIEKYEKIPLTKRFFIMGQINKTLFQNNIRNYYFQKNAKLFKALLIESKNEVQKHWGDDVKFVLIRCFNDKNALEDEIFKELGAKGFIVFDLYKYMDTKALKYKEGAQHEPLYWKDTAEILSKEFNLK